MDQLRLQYETAQKQAVPDRALDAEEVRDQLVRIRTLVDELPSREREALRLKYDAGLPAQAIADTLNLETRRQAYTLLERAVRHLRTLVARGRPGRARTKS